MPAAGQFRVGRRNACIREVCGRRETADDADNADEGVGRRRRTAKTRERTRKDGKRLGTTEHTEYTEQRQRQTAEKPRMMPMTWMKTTATADGG